MVILRGKVDKVPMRSEWRCKFVVEELSLDPCKWNFLYHCRVEGVRSDGIAFIERGAITPEARAAGHQRDFEAGLRRSP